MLAAGDSLGEEVLRMVLAERQAHGDFVTKISDMVWRRNGGDLGVLEAAAEQENSADVAPPQPEEAVRCIVPIQSVLSGVIFAEQH